MGRLDKVNSLRKRLWARYADRNNQGRISNDENRRKYRHYENLVYIKYLNANPLKMQ